MVSQSLLIIVLTLYIETTMHLFTFKFIVMHHLALRTLIAFIYFSNLTEPDEAVD